MPEILSFLQTIPQASRVMFWGASVLWAYVLGAARRKRSEPSYSIPTVTIAPDDPVDNIMRRLRDSAPKPAPHSVNGKFAKRSEG